MKVAWMLPLAALLWDNRAEACGCFTQPTVTTPVVQAGERILFAHEGNEVIAYIQIQYQGSADHFGWIVPLPSIPTLQIGTDELFAKLGATTQPKYQLTTNRIFCNGGSASYTNDSSGVGCGAFGDDAEYASATPDLGFANTDLSHNGEVVVQDSIGPYDYAVLKADDQTEMTTWLKDNGYFVPDATGEAVKPYIHPGAYFLALKLRAGQSAGDVTPIILRYTSDLPMIPITLTQVGAIPNMGVLVWELGESRAIPRNYHHVVLDEVPIWLGAQYQGVITSAVGSAPGKHAFVTEYAGPSRVMDAQLYYNGRFGDLSVLRATQDPGSYINYLKNHGYSFDSTLYAILQRYLPMPQAAIAAGVSVNDFYGNFDFFSNKYGSGASDGGVTVAFTPGPITDEIDMRIVTPTKATQSLFDRHLYLTRLYTTLSPKDMNLDPVFSENPDLPEVPLLHTAIQTNPCMGDSWLSTDQGFEVQYLGTTPPYYSSLPTALRLERLREEGQPEVVTDNRAAITTQLGPVVKNLSTSYTSNNDAPSSGRSSGCACDVSARTRNQLGTGLMVLLAGLVIRRRRKA